MVLHLFEVRFDIVSIKCDILAISDTELSVKEAIDAELKDSKFKGRTYTITKVADLSENSTLLISNNEHIKLK